MPSEAARPALCVPRRYLADSLTVVSPRSLLARYRLPERLVVAGLYVATGLFGFVFAIPPGNVTVIWAPSGIALAAVLLRGAGIWPGIWLGSFLVNTAFFARAEGVSMLTMGIAGAIAVGSTVQALVGVTLLRRVVASGRPFNRVQDVLAFVGIALLSCVIAATVGVTSLWLSGFVAWRAYPATWFTWWLGDLIGILMVSPFVLTLDQFRQIQWTPRRLAEVACLCACLVVVGQLSLGTDVTSGLNRFPAIMFLPALLWAAFRFGQAGVMFSIGLFSGIMMWGTAHGRGPFANVALNEALLTVQLFTGLITATGLVLAAILDERKRAEARLHTSLKEKEVLLKEIHHRVKNNLQLISSLLSLQAHAIGDDRAQRGFQQSQDRIRALALIHEQLYQSDDLGRIDLGAYLNDLIEKLQRSYGDAVAVTIDLTSDVVTVGIDAAIPCALIVNELVTNAVEHAFPDGRGGRVTVCLRTDHTNQVTLTISDNGVGFSGAIDQPRRQTLGLSLVGALVEQLGGTWDVEGGQGTAFRIVFRSSQGAIGT